jgi:short subunit dehydrogenase-like uncharacterized protein
MAKSWMIYGANGYTGKLAAELARQRGLTPILAGRSGAKIEALAAQLDLPAKVFSLDDGAATRAALAQVDAVLHCAGPYSATSRPMVDACLATATHYLDVTGEIGVFEAIHKRNDEARAAGVCLMPGVGFDVIPTDCLAARLAERLPDATHLELAFHGLAGASQGTTKTMIEALPFGGCIRLDGRIVSVPTGYRTRSVPFHDRPRTLVSVPWGDVSTAYYSTGIPNIMAYMSLPPAMVRASRLASKAGWVLGSRAVQWSLKKLVELTVHGPDAQQRNEGRTEVWGEVRNPAGRRVSGTLTTPNGYSLTADGALRSVERVLAGVEPGALTPSRAFGADFVETLDGVTVHEIVED